MVLLPRSFHGYEPEHLWPRCCEGPCVGNVHRTPCVGEAHVKDWAEFDVCLVPKKGDISCLGRWRPISLVPSQFKLYEVCMWKVLDKELKPLPSQMFGFRTGRQCLDIVSFLVEGLRKAEEWGEKLFVISVDVASDFDAVRAEILGDALLERGASVFSAAAEVRENLNLPCLGHISNAPVALEVGSRQGGSRTPSGWNQLVATLVDELVHMWASRGPAVRRATKWKEFEIFSLGRQHPLDHQLRY